MLAGSVALTVAALVPPLDRLAEASFAWHMVQHLLLLYIVPLLFLLSFPFEIFSAVLGRDLTARFVRATRPLHGLASPVVALGLYVTVLWATHFSSLYELALEHPSAHIAEHALYLLAGIALWTPVIGPPPLRPLPIAARVLYLVVVLPQGALVGAALTAARSPLYTHYEVLLGTSRALADQQNAAAIMWICGALAMLVALLVVVAMWAARERVIVS